MVDPEPLTQRGPWQPPPDPARVATGRLGLDALPRTVLHRIADARWTLPPLRIAVISDLHVCHPWVPPARVAALVARVNALGADLILVGGDVIADRYLPGRPLPAEAVVPLLDPLRAASGVFAVLGNHDWKDCPRSQATEGRENTVAAAFEGSPVGLLQNAAVQIDHGDGVFWLVGTDSAAPHLPGGPKYDARQAFATVPGGAPCIHLAHEPDCFAAQDPRAFLQISGHTHGGQGVLFGRRPMTPSAYGDRYAIGHVTEKGRHLIVSAGIGYTGLPMRIGVPPEITLIDLSPA